PSLGSGVLTPLTQPNSSSSSPASPGPPFGGRRCREAALPMFGMKCSPVSPGNPMAASIGFL
uniref:Uncharacterized protein n=1 Tax=Nothoprocta perdicaria TaxID=30464 RepID=A0A8C7EF02_NOTPE